jgi:uncharacterized protein
MQARADNGALFTTLATTVLDDVRHDRSHWQHGPIDIVMDLHGEIGNIAAAKQAMWTRFPSVLPELVPQLSRLRTDCKTLLHPAFYGPIASRMFNAVLPFRNEFITPMAAVAGSIAQELLEIAKGYKLNKAIINNGGDIAFFAQAAQIVVIRLLAPSGTLEFSAPNFQEFGIATSGWSGRSFSLGIADAVTVVATSAALADAAATMIANAVGPTLDHLAIVRVPADQLKDDSDLGSRLITKSVSTLPKALVKQALEQGQRYAAALLDEGVIFAASLSLQGDSVIVSNLAKQSMRLTQPSYQFKLTA